MYMAIFFTYNPSDFNSVAVALLPTIVLSGGSWYIKKRLLNSNNAPHDVNESGEPLNEVDHVLQNEGNN